MVAGVSIQPLPSLEGLKNMQRLLAMQNPKLADVNAANLMDITFMRKLEETGFIAQLRHAIGNELFQLAIRFE